jgi:hypothetical protein
VTGGYLFLGLGGLKPGWYRYLFDFADALRFAGERGWAAGFGCTIMISSGTRLPRTADCAALPRAILRPLIVSATDFRLTEAIRPGFPRS